MAQVIMVASGKGGTGKSTVAAFLAQELALSGYKTFITELDFALRSIDVICSVSEKAVYDVGDVLNNVCSFKDAVIEWDNSKNLHIMPSPYKKENTKLENLKKLVDSVYEKYDYIIIDTPAGFDKPFFEACKVCTKAIIVCTADIVSAKGARAASDLAFKNGVSDIRLVVNKYDKNTFKHSGFDDMDQIIDYCCAQLLGLIAYDTEIQVASMNGKMLEKNSLTKKIFSAMCGRLQNRHTQIYIK